MNIVKRNIVIVFMALCATLVSAQLPVYTCDFEDSDECEQWVLNPNKTKIQLENNWFIGEPGDFSEEGVNGLYISSDRNGSEPIYSAYNTMFVTAAREMPNLPAGNYRLYFDWKCGGKSNGEGLYVCWVPVDVATNSAPSAGDKPGWVSTYQCVDNLDTDSVFSKEALWTVGKVDIQHDGTPHKLVFLWYSTQGTVAPPSACIDNLELRPMGDSNAACAAPTNVTHTMLGEAVELKWKGNADYYDIRCYDNITDKWLNVSHVTGNLCLIQGLSEGVQTFIIRAYCGETSASDYVQYTQLIFHKGVRCIDYLDIKGKCYTGSYTTRVKNQRPFSTLEQVDYGYDDPRSRHTLHYIPNEYDALTNYQLRTCPEGYLASVRLGNADAGDRSGEAIEYKYKVQDGATSVLKIKYAAVLSNPHPETPEQNPQFWLDVWCNGKVISNDCGYTFFTAGDSDASGWLEGADGWLYKEWAEHSINLRDYVGETLTIRLVTTDCSPGAHTGYAYFVLDCEDGGMSGLNCGEDNPTTEFEAPSGFDYVWYPVDNPLDTISTDQHFHIDPLDTTVYNVNVINKNNKDCWYTLSAVGRPRIPMPKATYSAVAERCQNVVTFTNHSCVYLQNLVTEKLDPTTEPVTSLFWDFGDGSTEASSTEIGGQIQHLYPPEGGRYVVKLSAGISHDACVVTDSFILQLPDLSTPITEIHEDVCKVDYPFGYPYAGVWLYEDVDSVFTLIAQTTGCDSLCHLVLNFHDVEYYTYNDTICQGDTMVFLGKLLTQTGQYLDTITTTYGCDSIVELNLHVEPMLQINLQDSLVVCLDDKVLEIPYEVVQGRMDSVVVTFDSVACNAGLAPRYAFDNTEIPTIELPDTIVPNFYSAIISYVHPYCDVTPDTISTEVTYSTAIAIVKTDMLAIQNQDYNGGFAFDSIQWYKDGQLIPDVTTYNLALSPEDIGHVFSVKLSREGEDIMIGSCPIVYLPTGADAVTIPAMNWPVDVYTILGVHLGEMSLPEFTNIPSGIYLLSDGKNTVKVIL